MADKNFKVKTGLSLPQPLPADQGGTGQTSLANSLNAMLPSQAGNSAKILSTDGTNPTWIAQSVAYQRGGTESRPVSPTIGDLFYNTTYNYFESYTANGWFPIAAAPLAPTGVTATNTPSSRSFNDGRMTVAFSSNTNGGAPSSFIVTPTPTTSPSTFTGSTSPIAITGLASSTQYTYTVQATSPYGTSSASSASSGVTATTVPQAPTINSVTGGNAQADVAFTAGATGGAAISSYTVTSSPGSITASGSSSPITVTGLTNGTAYTFTMTATNANGTSLASSASSSVTPQSWSPEGAYDALATVSLSSSASSITFIGIPSQYKHLQIRGINRDSNTDTNINSLYITFNDIGGSSYSWHRLEGFGSGTPISNGTASTGNIWIGPSATNGYISGVFSAHIIDILDYSNSNKFKTVRHMGGLDNNGTGTEPGEINLTSGLFMSTNPITSITISKSGQNQLANTQFALYGVK